MNRSRKRHAIQTGTDVISNSDVDAFQYVIFISSISFGISWICYILSASRTVL